MIQFSCNENMNRENINYAFKYKLFTYTYGEIAFNQTLLEKITWSNSWLTSSKYPLYLVKYQTKDYLLFILF